ncbi:MAG: lipopolysaccharide biosynthesis protein [Ginsengibacter sp.]
MDTKIKEQTISGILWSFVERFGSVILQFVANIALARLLLPSDFGLIGLILVFISISNTFVDGGMGSALIQKTDANEIDFSTIFYVNILISVFLFVILFFSAPYISLFYKEPLLKNLLRVVGLVLVLNALSIIQNVLLVKEINFKRLAFVNVLSTFLACVVSVASAFYGYGVWSLVIQMLGISLFKSIFLWAGSNWRPVLAFSISSAGSLINYGYKLLLSGLIDSIYTGLYSLVIGKRFSSEDLGYYTQAKKLEDAPGYTLAAIVNQVTFPIFVKLADDYNTLKKGVKSSLVSLAYINFPLMILLIVIGTPLFVILFTHKWDEAIPYFKLLCLSGMLLSTHSVNLNIFKAVGKTDVYLLSEISKKIVGIIAIFIGLKWGMIGIISSIVFTAFFSFIINAYYSGKTIDYGIKEQCMDLLPSFLLSIVVGLIVYYIFKLIEINMYLEVILQVFLYGLLYILSTKIFNFKSYTTYNSILKNKFLKQINK